MAINEKDLLKRSFPDQVQKFSKRDTMLYALGVGLGTDPCDKDELRYVYEDGLIALPTFATTLCHPGFWVAEPDTGLNWRRIVHGDHRLTVYCPLPAEGELTGRTHVEEIIDRGPGKGAIVRVRRDLFLENGAPQSSQIMSIVARDDGGFGGTPPKPEAKEPWPERAADYTIDSLTLPQAALIYRLSGDYNPLHADPVSAKLAGFDKPILHGLCTYAIAGRSLIFACGDKDAARLSRLDVRFTSPVFPGETVRTEIWRNGTSARFRSVVPERDVTVLDRGYATFFN